MDASDKIYVHDKIYLFRNPIGVILGSWYLDSSEQFENIEYIRKDALIEWIKEHKHVIETHGDERDAYLRGEYSSLNSLINQLNSI